MNREIKFRAYLKESKVIVNIESYFKIKAFLDNTYYLDSNTINDSNCIIEDFELLQYTGLKDVNGKEIYEGDVLAWRGNDTTDNSRLSKVIYKGSSFYVVGINWMANWWLEEQNGSYEVIGNIFENPELLK